MAQPPLLALLLLGLFAPRSLAGYCFTSVASPINGYWTWGQTVSTPTLLGPLPLEKNPRAPSALHGGAGPRSVTPDGRTSPRDSTCAGNPRGPSLVLAWLPVLGKSMPRGTYLCPMPRATHTTPCPDASCQSPTHVEIPTRGPKRVLSFASALSDLLP